MVHREFHKPIRRHKVKGHGYEAQKNSAGVCFYTLMSAGIFWF